MSLADKVILITGAGGGLGSTAALALAKQGATIILLDNKISKMEVVYDRIVAAQAPEPVMYPFDLAGANEAQYEELATTVSKKYNGKLHGLLHSAVEFKAFSPLSNLSTYDWGHTLNVNLNAAFLLTRVLLPLMQHTTSASIVFTSDAGSRNAPAYSGAYGVSKIALEGLALILANELQGSGKVRVNTLLPGPVNSPLRRRAYPAEDKANLVDVNTLAQIYVFLFNEDSLGLTGKTIDAQKFNLTPTQ